MRESNCPTFGDDEPQRAALRCRRTAEDVAGCSS